ncbi:MAG: peptidylprolyl isomerase [Bacteroidetes bacterium]|nr:peptidylprolyl isomerase [Bacteroidota bacterium]
MSLKLSGLLLFLVLVFPTAAQVDNNTSLMTIAGKSVTVGEFMSIYQKNNVKGEAIDKKSMDEYLELFINFKLKVLQAEQLGLDTVQSFIKELEGYREQLAKPYFTDEATMNRLIQEAYDRKKLDLRASHIYFRIKPDATPQDTLNAYNKAMMAHDKILKGERFENVVMEFSEDPSAKDREATPQHPFMKGNRGDLGYFSVFDMVYPFETAAYTTQVGQISEPIRTDYGFHVIKVTDRVTALGDFVVAHLFLGIPKGASPADSARVKAKIDSLYSLLKAGAKFEDLVKTNSEDKGSSAKGGVLPKRGVNRLMPEFIAAISKIQNVGDFSEPVITPGYGWHIVKLIERKPIGTYDEEKADLKQRIIKDSRSQQINNAVVTRIKTEYGFTENLKARDEFYTLVTDSIFNGKWDPSLALEKHQQLFKIGNSTYTQREFAQYLAEKQKKGDKKDIRFFIDAMYEEFVSESVIRYEDGFLEVKYPDFRALMKEYRDGILLFDLTDQKVWTKAIKDTAGLQEFYQKNKFNYMWGQRVEASIFTLKNPALAQKVKNFIKSGLKDEDILKEMNSDTSKVLTIESGKFSKKDNHFIDTVPWIVGISKEIRLANQDQAKTSTQSMTFLADPFSGKMTPTTNAEDGKIKEGIVFVNIKRIIKPEPKSLNEARGLITADYQNYLEKDWIRYLRAKYPVVVNREVLAKIK